MERPLSEFRTLGLFLPPDEQRQISTEVTALDKAVVEPIKLRLKKDSDRTVRTQGRISELRKYSKSLISDGSPEDEKTCNYAYIGSLVSTLNLMTEFEGMVLNNAEEIPEEVYKQMELDRFRFVGPLTARIHGVSLADFAQGRMVESSTALPFFIETLRLNQVAESARDISSETIEGMLGENMGGLKADYPNKTKFDIASSIVAMSNILAISDAAITGKPKREFPEGHAQRSFNALSRAINNTRREIFKTLLNPGSSEESQALISAMSEYISTDEFVMPAFIASGIFTDPENAKTMYRKAGENIEAGVYPEFYSKVTEIIEESARPADKGDVVFARGINWGVDIPPANQNYWDDARRTANEIFKLASKSVYVVDHPDGLFHKTNVSFDPLNPSHINMTLHWIDDDDEEKRAMVYLDLKKRKFDWSFFDSPESDAVTEIRRVIDFTTVWALEQIKEKAVETHQAKLEAKKLEEMQSGSTQSANGHRAPKEHYRDPIYDLRKETVKAVKKEKHRQEKAQQRKALGLE